MKRLFAVLGLLACLMSVALAQDQSATNLYRPTATPPNPPCPYSRLYMNLSGEMSLVSCTGTVTVIGSGGGGSGTVTSVALSMPAIFTVSGSPVTSSGTLTAALANQSANLVFAGPTTGSAAAPTFRSLVAADVPNLDAAKITTGTIATARLGSGTANSSTVLYGDQVWRAPTFTVSGLMEAINAKRDFACVGDDTANDTTCLVNAINAAKATTGKQLYLPAGTYKTTAKLTIPGGVTIIGDGREKTIIHGTANDTILDLVQGTGSFAFKGPILQAVGVRGSSSGASQIGINVDDALYFEDVVLESVQVSATGSHGIYFGNVFSSKFTDIRSGGMNSGYPFLFNQLNMPGNLFESLYAGDVNSTHPAGYRIRTGDVLCIACNGINVSSSNSWWAIVGDKNGTDGATSNRSAYLKCLHCNIESSKAGGILHYYNSTSDIDGRSLFAGDSSASGTFIALKYEIDTSSGEIPSGFQRGRIGPLVTFANSPLSYYANSEVIHANDLPPVAIEGDTRQADGTIITSYRNTTNSRSEKIYRLDARKPITTITANASYTQPGATNFEVNCALGCTLTLPSAGYYGSREEFIYVRNIGAGTAVVAANSGGTMNGGANYSLSTGESVVFLPHSASADYRQVGLGGSGAANRIAFFNDIQHFSSNSGFTYDGTTVLNSRAGGNPYFAANDTSAGITTRFGPLAGAPDRAIIGTTSNHPLGLYANNAERWTISTSGHLLPGAASSYNIGSASLPINDFTLGGKLYWVGSTVYDLSGSGSPEGVVTAGIGSVYRRTNGSTGTTLYVKEAGTGNTGWSAVGGGGGSGLTNLNGLTAGSQSFAVGTSGTDFAISSATSTHTFNLPDAGASARGVVTTGSQTFAGAKTVTSVFTANPGTTPTTAILIDIASLGSAGTRDSNWLVFRGRSNDGTTHLTEWKQVVDVNTNAGGSNLSFQTRIDAAPFTEVLTISDAGNLSANDIAGATISASVGFGGDGSGLTNLDASQLITGTVASTRGGAGTINGILQANGSGVVSAVTIGAGLSFSGGTLNTVAGNPSTQIGLTATNGVATSFMRSDAAPALNVGISPTWTGSHVFTTTTVAREIDPQTDNTYDLGTTSLRWKTVHVGPGSVVVHNDATNTLKATLGFSGSTAQLVTNSTTPFFLSVGGTNGLTMNTSGIMGATGTGGIDPAALVTSAGVVPDGALSTNVPLLNGANTFTAAQVTAVDDATTNNFVNLLDLRHSTSGSPATGLGGSIRFGLESTTTVNRDAGRINVQWTTATDATRTSSMTFQLVNSAAALTTLLTIAGNGDLAAIGNITSGSVAVPTISSTSTFTNKTLTSSTNVLGGVTMTLGSDATGDIYYRNSGGVLTRLAAGSTSADLMVVSGLPSWKRRVFSIIAYGAACDGATTNDRAAIQSAIDAAGAAGGGVVSFEGCTSGTRIDTGLTIGDGSGTYSTGTATASTYNDITIDGASSKLRWYGSAGGTVFTVNGPFYRLKIRDLFINMKPSTNSAGIALDLNHVLLSEFSNIYINENSDYGIRIRAYGGWSGGDGANGNKFDNVTINSTTAGAKGIDIGYTAICTGCTLDPAQNQFNNFRARFDTGVSTYVSGSIGINLNFTDASQFNNPIIAAATALNITVPTGTGGASYPSAYMFTNAALTGTSSFAVSGTWTAAEKLGFYNYEVGDGEAVPADSNTFGITSNGVPWNMTSDAGFITGLQLEWVSTTQVKIKTGAAQIQSTGEIVTLASDSTISPTLSASAWHYCYLYLSSGTPTVECVTTAPATAWFGTARSKTSATGRRYIGAIKTNGSSQIYEFYHNAATNFYQWGEVTTSSPFRVLSGGTATTETSVDCTAVVPATGRAAQLRMINTEPVGGQNSFVRSRTGGPNQLQLRVNSDLITPIVLTSAQLFYYIYGSAPSTGATYIDVVGYYDNR